MIEADAIILGSPTYFAGMTAEMTALIDRAGYVAVANGGLFARKIGAAVVAQRRGGAVNVHGLDQPHVPDVPDDRSRLDVLELRRRAGEGGGRKRRRGPANMRDLGETIAWLLGRLEE